ncbi:MAG: hypothetical protein R2762_27610 [Bryobacteraceae bacterium]
MFALLILAGLGSSVVLVVWNSLLAARLLSVTGGPDAGALGNLQAATAAIRSARSETIDSDRISPTALLTAGTERLRRSADLSARMCAISGQAAQSGPAAGVDADAIAQAERAIRRACALRTLFTSQPDFDTVRSAHAELSARVSEAEAALESAIARIIVANAPASTASRTADALAAIVTGLVCALALAASLPGFFAKSEYRAPEPANGPWFITEPPDILSHARSFDNQLTVIAGYNELLLTTLPSDHPNRPDLEETRVAIARAEDILRQMMNECRDYSTAFQ